ncbi:MAG: twin-arginine translocase subunit TatC [Acidobacteriota bacterium]
MGPRDARYGSMSFLEHLEELRSRMLRSLLALAIAFLICWVFSSPLYEFLARPVMAALPPGKTLAFTALPDPFILYMKVALLTGIFLASPYLLWQLWLFVAPGLYGHERRLAIPFLLSSTALFVAGGAFGYYIAFPAACRFFLKVGQPFEPILTVREYFRLEMQVLLVMGLVFELPVFIFFFSRLGIVTPRFLWEKFTYAVLIIFVTAAIITPPDFVSQLLIALPMVVLYLVGIGVAWLFGPAPVKPTSHDPPEGPAPQ